MTIVFLFCILMLLHFYSQWQPHEQLPISPYVVFQTLIKVLFIYFYAIWDFRRLRSFRQQYSIKVLCWNKTNFGSWRTCGSLLVSLGSHILQKHLGAGYSLPGKFHGKRSMVGYNPWGHEEQDTTEQLSIHTHRAMRYAIALRKICTFTYI